MLVIKPNQASVCTQKEVWNEMCKIAVTKPTEAQIKKAEKRSRKFSKVFKR